MSICVLPGTLLVHGQVEQQYAGTQIPINQAQPGDLLFWGSSTGVTTHVGIYLGENQFIHAPQPGETVKITSISEYTPDFAVRIDLSKQGNEDLFNYSIPNQFDEPLAFTPNQSTKAFLEKIAEDAREIGQKEGIYASVMQADIDSVRAEIQKLPDGESKTQYLSKLDQAFNQLQELTLRSDVGETFATINVTPNKLILRTTGKRPSSYGTFLVSQLKIIRGGREILRRDIRANDNLSNEQLEYTLQNGDKVEIFIHDPRNGVLTNHDKLNPNHNNNSLLNFVARYTIVDGLLVLQDKYNEVVNAVRNLYEDEAQTIVKKTLEQTAIDQAREKVNTLPDGEEKTALLEKVDRAYNGLQEIQLKGYYNRLFSRITVTNGKLLVRTEEGRPHSYIEDNYAEIDIRRGDQSIYHIGYYGNEVYTQGTEEINIQDGDIVTVMKKEATEQRMVVNHPELKPNNDGNYTYVVQDGLLIEASRKVQLDAQNAVKGLYEDEAQTIVKKDLLQENVDATREKVNALPDGEEKTSLLAKVDQAFNGLQEIQLRGGYDTLF
jgi:site-specific DNA-adenine methylase